MILLTKYLTISQCKTETKIRYVMGFEIFWEGGTQGTSNLVFMKIPSEKVF